MYHYSHHYYQVGLAGNSDLELSLTWMSWLSRVIIVASPVSVDQGWTSVKFKFFSRATLLHVLCFFGPMLLLIAIAAFDGNVFQILTKALLGTLKTYNPVDCLSILLMISIIHLSTLLPTLLATGIPAISSLALSANLRWPKYGFCTLSGAILFMCANFLSEYFPVYTIPTTRFSVLGPKHFNLNLAAAFGFFVPWMSEDCWTTTVTILLVLYFIILSFWNLYTCLVFTCLLSWVNNLTFKASAEPRFNPFAVADHCLSLYNSLQEGMSTAFYAFFTFSQSDLITIYNNILIIYNCIVFKSSLQFTF